MRKILVILLVLLLCGSLFFLFDEKAEKQPEKSETVSTTHQIETTEKAVPTDTEETTAINETKLEIQPRSTFEIYYLDVGQGDAACVLCDGHAMLIDGGDRNKSDLMYSFLKSHSISKLDCVIASHPDADHTGAFAMAEISFFVALIAPERMSCLIPGIISSATLIPFANWPDLFT